jgi:hypothetical protein
VLEDAAKGFTAVSSQADSSRARGQRSDLPISGPLRVSKNPRYYADASGAPLILCGSHSWNTLQDWGLKGKVQELDFDAFIRFLKAHGHNCTFKGKTYFELERLGTPSRWNTLRALRVLKWWDGDRKRDQSCSQQSSCSFLACCMNVHYVQTIETATMISRASAEALVDQTEARYGYRI